MGKRRSRGKGGVEQPFPWRDWQKVAFGGLGWMPQTFWSATLTEFILAAHGWSEANGAKKEIEPPSENQLDDLIKKYGG
nr:phage tail assembly chaperone [Agrobacterium sp. rho-8.1]